MSNRPNDLMSLIKTETGQAAFQKLLEDRRIQTFISHMPMDELAEGVIMAAFLRASDPWQINDNLETTFTAAILNVDEANVQEARAAIREYAALVGAQAYLPQ